MKNTPSQLVKIWDIWIRLFHWSLAALVLFLLISGTTGWQFYEWHRTAGETVLALLLFRLCWGLVGSDNARLTALVTKPLHALKHLVGLVKGRIPPERGHNSAGGWAVLAMLSLIGFQAISGLVIADEEEYIEGAFYGVLSDDLSYELLKLHIMNATIIKVVVAVHVLMILVYALRASHNLLTPMITGHIKWPSNVEVPYVGFQKGFVGCAIALGCLVAMATIFSWW